MTNIQRIVLVTLVSLVLTSLQLPVAPYGRSFLSFGSQLGSGDLFSVGARDPRSDTGPVLFPPSPPGDPSQTSGVVVGASGYGFVPPGSQGPTHPGYYHVGFFIRR